MTRGCQLGKDPHLPTASRCGAPAPALQVFDHRRGKAFIVKTAAIWIGAMLFGFIGGLAGQKFSTPKFSNPRPAASDSAPLRSHTFELTDPSGRVVSLWTTDKWGRPFIGLSDAKWEGRIVIGPLYESDFDNGEPPDPNAAWGIRVTAPGHAAYATVGTSVDEKTKKPSGFASWR